MNLSRTHFYAWLACAVAVSSASPADAQTTYYVNGTCGDDSWTGANVICQGPDGPKRTIQAGVDACITGDTVAIANGTYTGDGNRDIDDTGRSLVLRSESGDPSLCIIDIQATGSEPHRAFTLNGDTVIEGFTMRRGFARGGAIRAESGSPTIVSCIFEENGILGNEEGGAVWLKSEGARIESCVFLYNDAYIGGALYIESGSVMIRDCRFERNHVYGGCEIRGGAIFSAGDPTLVDCEFRYNHAEATPGCGGNHTSWGGAFHGTFATMEDCLFLGNRATGEDFGGGAGGAFVGFSTGTVRDCVFINNFAESYGGAVVSAAAFIDCQFIGNRSSQWGSASSGFHPYMYPNIASQSFTNCLFRANISETGRGTLDMGSGSSITNCTFIENQGRVVFARNGDVLVSNSILQGNTGTNLGQGVTLAYSCIDFTYPGVGVINDDPRFVDPASDFHLMSGSPAIDAADNTALPAGVTTDLDGNPRFVDDPNAPNTGLPGNGFAEIVDMGAYEFQNDFCYADCHQSNGAGVLDIFDFLCWQGHFVIGGAYACDCDTSTGLGVCDVFDFLCFQSAFVAGCP